MCSLILTCFLVQWCSGKTLLIYLLDMFPPNSEGLLLCMFSFMILQCLFFLINSSNYFVSKYKWFHVSKLPIKKKYIFPSVCRWEFVCSTALPVSLMILIMYQNQSFVLIGRINYNIECWWGTNEDIKIIGNILNYF
jgi:hypothetical protein